MGWSDPTFAHGSVPKVSRESLQPNKKLLSVRAARMWAKQLKKVGITHFSFVFSIFFSLGCA
jgi:hypothetical protein